MLTGRVCGASAKRASVLIPFDSALCFGRTAPTTSRNSLHVCGQGMLRCGRVSQGQDHQVNQTRRSRPWLSSQSAAASLQTAVRARSVWSRRPCCLSWSWTPLTLSSRAAKAFLQNAMYILHSTSDASNGSLKSCFCAASKSLPAASQGELSSFEARTISLKAQYIAIHGPVVSSKCGVGRSSTAVWARTYMTSIARLRLSSVHRGCKTWPRKRPGSSRAATQSRSIPSRASSSSASLSLASLERFAL
eukprot:1349436-Rhodomonas_salina.1